MDIPEDYIAIFAALAEHTAPKCGACRSPHACCNPAQCEDTRRFALETFGITLEDTGNTIPFLGPQGCVVPPHLRPICSVHVCETHLMDDGDPWVQRYYELREEAGEALEAVDPM